MKTGDICTRETTIVQRTTPLNQAARIMRENHVGCLVVAEAGIHGNVPVGILTDRDIVVEAVAMDLDCGTLLAGEVMTAELLTVTENDPVPEALRLMREHGIRRIPVLTPWGTLAGIVTLDDLLEIVAEELADMSKVVMRERNREDRVRAPLARS